MVVDSDLESIKHKIKNEREIGESNEKVMKHNLWIPPSKKFLDNYKRMPDLVYLSDFGCRLAGGNNK